MIEAAQSRVEAGYRLEAMPARQDADTLLEALAAGLLRDQPARAHPAFEGAWPALERALGSFLRSLRVRPELWDDCGQATLLRVWTARRRYRGGNRGELLAWMYRICLNEHRRLLKGLNAASATEDAGPATEDSSYDAAAQRDTRDALDDCVTALDGRQREIVELLYSTAAPTEREVAALTGCSKSHVNQLRQAALAALERCLRNKGETL